MTIAKKATPVRLKLLFSLITVLLFINLSFGENEIKVEPHSTYLKIEHVKHSNFAKPTLPITVTNLVKAWDKSVQSEKNIEAKVTPILSIELAAPIMEDTACTSNTMDTFFVNTVSNIDSYLWTLPSGANIVSTIGDTMIIVDWTNSVTGLQEICVQTTNNCGPSSPVCFPIRIRICNLSPNAVPDRDTTPSNTPITVDVQINDSDPENGILTTNIYSSGNPNNGSISLDGNDIQYTPNTNFTGTDNFNYYVCDDGNPNQCDTTIVTIVVENTPPIAVNDQANATVGSTINITVQDNDSDPENQVITTSLFPENGPTKGTVSLNGNDIQYTPNAGATISDQFDYIICDNDNPSLCDTATVTITLDNQNPIAVNDRDSTLSNTPITIAVQTNDSDPENGSLSTSLLPTNAPSNGTLTITGDDIQYTPNTDFTGTDMFGYIICDDGMPSLCDTANVTVVVLNQQPNAVDDLTSTPSGVSVSIPVQNNDTDAENGDLTTAIAPNNGPSNGTISLNGDEIIYTPGVGFSGTDMFDYIICDDGIPSLCDTATVTISTENQAPIAVQDIVTTQFQTSITIDVQANDIDPEGGVLTTTLNPSFLPSNGAISVVNNDSILYTPDNGFLGIDQFGYIICDSGVPSLCDTTIVTVSIPNDPPIAVNDINNTTENTPVDGEVLINDYDLNGNEIVLTQVLISSPPNGTVNLNSNGTYTYTPFTGFTGEDVFEYEICDVNSNESFCDTGKVVIEVIENSLNTNRPPVANPDNYISEVNSTLSGNLLNNDLEPDGDNILLNTLPLEGPTNGSVIIFPGGNFEYTPDTDFMGEDTFVYNICDNGNPTLCDTTTVTINLVPNTGNNIFAIDDAAIGDINRTITGNVSTNDNDPEGHSFTTKTTPILPVTNGTLILNTNGTFSYTPTAGYTGPDHFQYEICDNQIPNACDTATVYLTILPSNQPPIALDNINITQKGIATTGNILENDFDLEMDNIVLNTSPLDAPDNGNVTINSNGFYTYTPDAEFLGTDYFTYEICDDGIPNLCDTARAIIEVIGNNPLVNDKPIAINDKFVTAINTPLDENIIGNDVDPDGNTLNINTTPVSQPTNGMVSIRPNGTYLYTPDTDYVGADQFEYSICDNGSPSRCDTAAVHIDIISPNPLDNWTFANEDTYVTNEDVAINADLLINDTDPEGDNQTIETTPTRNPNNGSLTINTDGSFDYIPNINYVGNDQFDYKVCDSKVPEVCDTTTVYLTILPVNDAPIAQNDSNITDEDTSINGTVVSNDNDPENDNLTVDTTLIKGPNNGVLVLGMDGTYLYTPAPNFNGQDTFQYKICDEGIPSLCDTAEVIIIINPENDKPIAVDDFNSTDEDISVGGEVLSNDTDVENDNLTVNTTPIVEPANGITVLNMDGTYTYTPAAGYNGIDSFQYEMCDNGTPNLCDTATVTISIGAVNDAPIAVGDINTTDEDTPVDGMVLPNDNDPDNDNLTVDPTPIENPTNGTLVLNANGIYTYTPDPNFNGLDTFRYEICDDGTPSLCDTSEVIITINPINDKPLANDDTNTTDEDTPVNGLVLPNDVDLENDDLTVNTTPIEEPENGDLVLNEDGTYTYTPDLNFNGQDIFRYEVCDDANPSLCDTAEVVITITPLNDAPVATNDVNTTDEDTPVNGLVLPNDSDVETLNLGVQTTPVEEPTNGTLVLNEDGSYTYTPNPDFYGQDTFQYKVFDQGIPVLCDTAEVIITVVPTNDKPIAEDDSNITDEDTPVSGMVLSNDVDLEEDDLMVATTPLEEPENGNLNLNEDGTYTYTPDLNFNGQDTFQYVVCDNGIPSLCDTAEVIITINPANDRPVAVDDVNTTEEDTPVDGLVLPNDSDVEMSNLIVQTTPVEAPSNGTVVLNEDGSYTYTPDQDFYGLDTFQYKLLDQDIPALCDTAMVVITINPVNDQPVAANDTNTTDEDTTLEGEVLPNDSDLEEDALTVNTNPIEEPNNGDLILNEDGTYVYTPELDFNGLDTFQYVVCDNGSPSLCDTAMVIITITPTNDAPIAVDDSYGTPEDTPLSADLAINDTDPDEDNLGLIGTPVEGPTNGTVTLNPNGTFIYLPAPAYNGQDTFQYEICDNQIPNLCDTAEVIITIGPLNDAPYAINDINITTPNTPTTGNVLFNDFDPEDDVLDLNTTPLTDVENGTLVLNEDGTYTYTPDPEFTGEDVFLYEVCDINTPALCDTAEVVITVIGENPTVNDPPTAINDNFVTLLNTDIPNINLLTNDFDPDGDDIIINVTPIDAPDNGIIIIQTDGLATYQPDSAFLGNDGFTYQICDDGSPSLCDTAKVTISVFPDAIIDNTTFAGDDAGFTFEDTPLFGILNDNDSDPEGDNQMLQTNPATPANNGLVTINQDGSFEYIPNPEYSGPDFFRYIVCDDGNPIACDTATVYLTILEQNDPPYAINDVNIIPINTIATGNILANDFDIEGDNIFVNTTPVSQPINGTATINPDGTYSYIPATDFEGEDTFQYVICDDGVPVLCDTATVTIEIIDNDPLNNDPPVGVNDVFITLINTSVASNIIINDFDIDGDNIVITTNPVVVPSNGNVIINSDGTFEYTPNFNFTGDDTFSYRICDDQNPSLCTVAKVTITVIPRYNINFTYANDDITITKEDTPVSGDLLANDTDPEGHIQTLNTTPIKAPNNGTVVFNLDGTFIYTPAENYFGVDQFTYLICDSGTPSVCDSANAIIFITAENDSPIALEDVNNTILNTPVEGNVLTNDIEFEGHLLVLQTNLATQPTNGTVVLDSDGYYIYTPNQNFLGEDLFEYTVCDNQTPIRCDTTHVIIEVLDATEGRNNPPNGVEDNVQTTVGIPFRGSLISNDSDIDGDALIINTTPIFNLGNLGFGRSAVVFMTENGTVEIFDDGTFEYIPNLGFQGEETFAYEICDAPAIGTSLCDTVLVTIDVIPNPFNNNIIYATDDAGIMWEDQSYTSNLLVNDQNPSGDPIQVISTPVRLPEFGSVVINANAEYTYTPNPNYNGPDRFLYVVCDNLSPQTCDTATVYLTVLSTQDPPIAKDDINLTLINTVVSGRVSINDSDADGDNLTVTTTPFIGPQNGAINLNMDGSYEYTPNNGFVGEDSFDYIICQDQTPVLCDTATVTIKVIDNSGTVNNPPVGVADVSFGQINTPINSNLLINDSDPDGDPIIINTSPISDPVNGTLVINPDGTYTYTPNSNFIGEDMFEYEVCDLGNPQACDTVQVTLEIFPNQGNNVLANDDAATGDEDSTIRGAVLTNDLDPQGDNLVLNTSPTSLPQHGTVELNMDGTFTYSPTADYHGPDQFTYEICDDLVPPACAMATVYLTVLPVNDTLCNNDLPKPTLLTNGDVCFNENIFLFIQENYPLFTIENTDLNFEFTWYNGTGAIIATSTEPNLTLAANHPDAISPFTVKVRLEDCSSDFADPAIVNITQLPVIAATNSSGDQGICANESVELTATLVEDANYEWRIAGETNILSTSPNLTIVSLNTTTTYEVMVMPAECDTFATATVTVMLNDAPIVNPQQANTEKICMGSAIQLMSNATGTAPFTYEWAGPANFTSTATNPIIANAQLDNAGTYTVNVRDANGCTAQGELTVNNITEGIDQPVINSNMPVCVDGTIEINLQTPYLGSTITYNWINGLGNSISTDRNLRLAANDTAAISPFILQVTVDGCQSPNSEIIAIEVQDTPIALATTDAAIICKGGEIQLNANEVSGATYEWRILGSPAIISTLQNPILSNIQQSMDYTLTIRGGVCPDKFAIDTVSVAINPAVDFELNRNYTLNQNCSVANLALTANVVGNSSGLGFRWTGPNDFLSTQENPVIEGIDDTFNGTYTLEITDENGCSTNKSIFINDLQGGIARPAISVDRISCESENIVLSVPLYEGQGIVYNWFQDGGTLIGLNNTNELFIDDATPGASYNVTIKIGGCLIESDTLAPIVFDQPIVTIAQPAPVSCTDGTEELTLNATITGGQAPYEIVWSGSNGFLSFKEDPVLINVNESLIGTYSIEVIDKNGCSAMASTEVDVKDAPIQPTISISGNICEGEEITLTAPAYEGANVTYNWQTPNNQNIAGFNSNELVITTAQANLHQGTYNLSVIVDGCETAATAVTIDLVDLPTIKPTAIYNATADCASSNLLLQANLPVNTDDLAFEWTGPNGFISNLENPIIVNATPENNGQYALKITNRAGCSLTEVTNTIENIKNGVAQPTIQIAGTFCEGEQITLTAPIYEGSSVNYNWTVPDSLNIIGFNTNELMISQADPNLNQGEYLLTVNVDGCTVSSAPVNVGLIASPTIKPLAVYAQTPDCASSNLELQANLSSEVNGLTFEWTGPNGFISNLENPVIVNATPENNGQYALKITNGAGCSRTEVTNTIENIKNGVAQPTIQIAGTFCEGEQITLTAPIYEGSNVSYNWSVPDSQNVNGFNTNELVISQADPNLNQGEYLLIVIVDGCTVSSAPVNVDLIALPTIRPQAIYTQTSDCVSSSLELQANLSSEVSGLTYEWTGPNGYTSNVQNPIIINASEEQNGQYALKITNSLGCSQFVATNTIENIKTALSQPIIQTSEAVCEGGLMVLNAPIYTGNSVNYTWLLNGQVINGVNTNEITIGPLADSPDEYVVQINVDDCQLTSEAIIPTVLPMTDINPSFELSDFCEGGSLQLSANTTKTIGNVTYNWSGPNGYTSNAENPYITRADERYNGTYTLTINTLSGCSSSKSVTVSGIVDEPRQPTVLTNSPVCANSRIELSIQQTSRSDQYNYLWINGSGDTIGTARTLSILTTDRRAIAPYYAQVIAGSCGAVSSIPIMVDIISLPSIQLTNNGPLCPGDDLYLAATQVEDASYEWTNTTTGAIVSLEQNPSILAIDTTTTFSLKVSIGDCRVSSTVSTTVTVTQKPSITQITKSTSLCEGQDLILTAVNGNPTSEMISYTWTGPNNFVFIGESTDNLFPVSIPNFQANQAGTYKLTIGGVENCSSDSRSVVISVSDELITPTLTAATNLVCGGESILLTASTENGSDVNYEWYLQTIEGDLFLIRETTTPTMIISNSSAANSGEYIVRISKRGCNSGFSNTTQVTVLDINSNITTENNTSAEKPICEGEIIQLSAPFFEGATYTWFGPAGFTADKPNPIISAATTLAAGDYFVVINLEGCSNITSATTTVYVKPQPSTPTIINSGAACVGETVTISVASTLPVGDNDTLIYEWYNAFTNSLLRTTTVPNLILSNIAESQSGNYYLRLVLNGCPSDPSNETLVEVVSPIDLNVFAGNDQSLCTASTVQLNATQSENGSGVWTSPTGAAINNSTSPSTLASDLQAGINQFVWTVSSGQCTAMASDTVEVFVATLTSDKAFAGLDQDLCEVSSINLAATALTSATGSWTQSNNQAGQGVIIMDATSPTTSIEGLVSGNSYTFIWTISQGECTDFSADTVQVIINDLPPDNALIRDENIILCDEDQLTLNAEFPSFSEGRWLTETGANIAAPTSPSTFAENLNPGENVFVWALSNGACMNYSTDTLIVHSERMPMANADNYELNLNDSLVMDVLENDALVTNVDVNFRVSKFPDNGELIENEDGTLTYKPNANFFGFDNFRYKICSNLCEELCDTAIVTIGVTGVQGSGDCIIPNVISPNGDGVNDNFLVSCINEFPDNQLKIFNRWGDEVYSIKKYQNDWNGTYKDLPLPSGTYFYILQLTEEGDPLQGFITIFR